MKNGPKLLFLDKSDRAGPIVGRQIVVAPHEVSQEFRWHVIAGERVKDFDRQFPVAGYYGFRGFFVIRDFHLRITARNPASSLSEAVKSYHRSG